MSAAYIFIILCPILFISLDKIGPFTTTAIVLILPRLIRYKPNGTNPLAFLLVFLFGMIFSNYDLFKKIHEFKFFKQNTLSQILKFIVLSMFIVVFALAFKKIPRDKIWEFHYTLFPVIFIIFCSEFLLKIKPLQIVLAFFGKHSLYIFLTHTIARLHLLPYNKFFNYWLEIPLLLLAFGTVMSFFFNFLTKITHYNDFIKFLTQKIENTKGRV